MDLVEVGHAEKRNDSPIERLFAGARSLSWRGGSEAGAGVFLGLSSC